MANGKCVAVVVLGLLLLTVAAACSGGGGSSKTTVPSIPPAVQTEVAATAAAPTPTIGPDAATAAAAGPNVELTPFADASGRYTVQLPLGWTVEGTPDALTAFLPGAPLTSISVLCQAGLTADELRAQDQRISERAGGGEVLSTDPAQVAGGPATRTTSVTTLGGTAYHHITVYFEGKGCAWHVQLTTISATDYGTLLDKILASFSFS